MKFAAYDEVVAITPLNPFDRFADGRPRVPDELLERMKDVTIEQAWGVLGRHGYEYQFEGNWVNLHPERVMVGRAITATMVPIRPDLNNVVNAQGKMEGRGGSQNNWVIQTVGDKDVVVVDLFGKVKDGTFVGDNLSTAVQSRGGSGLVIDGGIRDTTGVNELPGINVFCRGFDPTAIRNVTLVGFNGPTRIGQAICMPGDVVLGTLGGIIFIPPHLVKEVLEVGDRVRLRDELGKLRLKERKYTSGQIDGQWSAEIDADFQAWQKERQK